MISYCDDEAKKPSKGSQYLQMQSVIKEMDTVAQIERSIEPRAKAVIPFLIMYMKEKSNNLFILLKENLSDKEILEAAQKEHMSLIMVIEGQSIFHAAKCDVVIFGEYIIKIENILEGFLTIFLCYYVFGFNYPKTVNFSLEFMQRCSLGINPKQKGKNMEINSKISKLANALQIFESQCSTWSLS